MRRAPFCTWCDLFASCHRLTSPLREACEVGQVFPCDNYHCEQVVTGVSLSQRRPNHRLAMLKNEKKPTTSVTVVTNGLDATAGSILSRCSARGIRIPPNAAATRLQIMARPMTKPRPGTLNQT